MQLRRPAGDALVVVDATSAAGGLRWDPAEVDVYYFAPQKCFASDGGLWLAACSPAAHRADPRDRRRRAGCRPSLDLKIALDNSLLNQTYNTPALATLVLLDDQLRWMLDNGGLDWCAERSETSAAHLYGWADEREWATPFVADPAKRSAVVGTIDLAAPTDGGVDANDGVRRAAGQRHRRHRQLPQARPQPAAHRHVPGHRTRRRRRAHRAASTTSSSSCAADAMNVAEVLTTGHSTASRR